jgi:hypothetical protein
MFLMKALGARRTFSFTSQPLHIERHTWCARGCVDPRSAWMLSRHEKSFSSADNRTLISWPFTTKGNVWHKNTELLCLHQCSGPCPSYHHYTILTHYCPRDRQNNIMPPVFKSEAESMIRYLAHLCEITILHRYGLIRQKVELHPFPSEMFNCTRIDWQPKCMLDLTSVPHKAYFSDTALCSHVTSVCYMAESINTQTARIAEACSTRRCPSGFRHPSAYIGMGDAVIMGQHTPDRYEKH